MSSILPRAIRPENTNCRSTQQSFLPGALALWHRLASRHTASPKVWMDAYLAAFAITGALRMVSLDHDFRSFKMHGLDLVLLNP